MHSQTNRLNADQDSPAAVQLPRDIADWRDSDQSLEASALKELALALDATRRELQDHREILKDALGALISSNSSQGTGDNLALNEQLLEATQRLSWHLEQNGEDLHSMMENVDAGWSLKTDNETGLSNRRGLEDSLTLMLGLKERYGVECAIL